MSVEFRVIIAIPEDDEWDEQELVDSRVFHDQQKAQEYADSMLLGNYPNGTATYLEWRTKPEWRRL